jgi:putative PIN family toxin of toxin-antitoxin system
VRAVFDTNVLLAAFLTEGVCEKLLARARKRHFDLITCPFILHEFDRTLAKKFSATKQERETAFALIAEAASDDVTPADVRVGACRDRDDDNVVACAVAAGAAYLVTGDKDLLALKKYQGVAIITPREFELLFDQM